MPLHYYGASLLLTSVAGILSADGVLIISGVTSLGIVPAVCLCSFFFLRLLCSCKASLLLQASLFAASVSLLMLHGVSSVAGVPAIA